MQTRTQTDTISVTATDVRTVMELVTEEISWLQEAYADVPSDFQLDEALVDCSLLVLNQVINAIRLQFYRNGELIREHAYLIRDGTQASSGPSSSPPLGYLPEETRVRLAVTPNPDQPKAIRDAWLARLGWQTATALRLPANATCQSYGALSSGGFGVERQLLVHPDYDRPVSAKHHAK